jgi:hypothetical protein
MGKVQVCTCDAIQLRLNSHTPRCALREGKWVNVRDLTREQTLELIDARIDEAAQIWKDYARQSDFAFADMANRVHQRNPIVSPRQQ